jgi:CRISPR-associated endonuclease Cas1
MSTARLRDVSHDHAPVEIVDGYGAEIRVSSNHLVLRNGDFGSADRAERWIARGRSRLKRIVILSHEGIVTLDALEFMTQLHVAMIVLDYNGRLTCCSSPEVRHDAELRRTQAIAGVADQGLEIAAWIVNEKLRMQSAQLRKLIESLPAAFGTDERRGKCEKASRDIDILRGRSPGHLRGILSVEGRAAQIYWGALEGQAISWARKSADRVPSHWLQIQPRTSGVNGLAQDARDPFQAALNYVLAVLEAECKIAAAKVGLDSDFGFLHVDEVNRQSFIYDLMELARTRAENLTLSFFFGWRERDTPIRSGNFIELRDGVCRLGPEFARSLVDFVQSPLRSAAERAAEDFVRRLRLHETVSSLKATRKKIVSPSAETAAERRLICDYCGGPMRGQGRRFCGRPCFLRWSVETNRPIEKAQATLAQLRAEGRDPSHGGEAAEKRGAANKAALAETWAWRRSEAGQAEAHRTRAAKARTRRQSGKV